MKQNNTVPHTAPSERTITHIATRCLMAHEKNSTYFRDYTGDKWQMLLGSISTDGILHPLLVTAQSGADMYIIISGHQRLRAARHLGLSTVPCIVHTESDDITTERQLIATNHIQREYNLSEKYRLASRLLELSEPRQRDNTGKYLPRGQNAHMVKKDIKTRDIVARQTGLTDHDLKQINAIKKLPTETQSEIWAWLDGQNPNKTQLRKRVLELQKTNKKLKRQVGKIRNLSTKEKQLTKQQQHINTVLSTHPQYMHIEKVMEAFAKAESFMTQELSRITHLPIPLEARREEHIRMYARMIVSMLEEYKQLITTKFIKIEEQE